jgi:hypothetical protein
VVLLTFDPELAPGVAGFARACGTAVIEPRIAAPVLTAAASLADPGVLRGASEDVATLLGGTAARIDRRVARVAES